MKKITVYRIILVILVITALVLATLVIRKNVENRKIENNTQAVLQEIKKGNKTTTNEIDVIQEIDEEIGGYKVIGIINIPKINIEYPILEKTNEQSLKLSITKFYGEKINQKGNVHHFRYRLLTIKYIAHHLVLLLVALLYHFLFFSNLLVLILLLVLFLSLKILCLLLFLCIYL